MTLTLSLTDGADDTLLLCSVGPWSQGGAGGSGWIKTKLSSQDLPGSFSNFSTPVPFMAEIESSKRPLGNLGWALEAASPRRERSLFSFLQISYSPMFNIRTIVKIDFAESPGRAQ